MDVGRRYAADGSRHAHRCVHARRARAAADGRRRAIPAWHARRPRAAGAAACAHARADRQADDVPLQPDRMLRAHLPEREFLRVAVPARRGRRAGRCRPLPLLQDGGRAVSVRVARESGADARRRADRPRAAQDRRQDLRLSGRRFRHAVEFPDRRLRACAERNRVPVRRRGAAMTAVPGSGRLRADFGGRVVLVTGAAQGIGAAIARRFAESDAFVAVADLNGDAAAAQADALASAGGDARAYRVDAASRGDLDALVAAVERDGGRLDVVIHNAAYFPLTPFMQIDEPTLDRTLSVNLSALFWLAQAALPAFERAGAGRLLVTSSVTGPRVVYPGLAHYAASKAGVNGFIRAAALELARRNVTVNGVEPGMIRTPAAGNLGDASVAAQIARDIPLARMGEPEDIANAMLFLASADAAYVTGQTIVVDGGATLPESGAVLGDR
ncbi:Short-chain dehydrogenase/reductase SDR [Burkholderia cenocepacia PC184]|nr:Short-chain dehydrogenase/reductase SDR [Burkholderia cenocepacia PC184]